MTAIAKTQVVSFCVQGKFLADLARERLTEGAGNLAINFLTDSLEGLSHEDAIRILQGRADLAGDTRSDDGIYLVDLDEGNEIQEKVKARLDYMYGDLFRISDKIWQPYAYVTGLDQADYNWALKSARRGNNINTRGGDHMVRELRPLYYADDQENDLLVVIPQQIINGDPVDSVLCRKFTDQVPLFVQVKQQDPVKWCSAVMQNRRLEKRGAELDLDFHPVAGRHVKPPVMRRSDAAAAALQSLSDVEAFLQSPASYAELRAAEIAFERFIDTEHQFIDNQNWDRVEKIRVLFGTLSTQILRNEILQQAESTGGFMELRLGEGAPQRNIRVPKNPFLRWCLRNIDLEKFGHEKPSWKNVCASGMKISGDDPNHSDWFLGAGLSLDNPYSRDEKGLVYHVNMAAYEMMDKVIKEYTGRQFTVLSRGSTKHLIGEVVFPKPGEKVALSNAIAIVPHAGPEYQEAMISVCKAGGILVVETGGKLAHLAIVGKELNCTVVMIPGSMKLYWEGQTLSFDVEDGIIHSFV